jgi:hypothetical protein
MASSNRTCSINEPMSDRDPQSPHGAGVFGVNTERLSNERQLIEEAFSLLCAAPLVGHAPLGARSCNNCGWTDRLRAWSDKVAALSAETTDDSILLDRLDYEILSSGRNFGASINDGEFWSAAELEALARKVRASEKASEDLRAQDGEVRESK